MQSWRPREQICDLEKSHDTERVLQRGLSFGELLRVALQFCGRASQGHQHSLDVSEGQPHQVDDGG